MIYIWVHVVLCCSSLPIDTLPNLLRRGGIGVQNFLPFSASSHPNDTVVRTNQTMQPVDALSRSLI